MYVASGIPLHTVMVPPVSSKWTIKRIIVITGGNGVRYTAFLIVILSRMLNDSAYLHLFVSKMMCKDFSHLSH